MNACEHLSTTFNTMTLVETCRDCGASGPMGWHSGHTYWGDTWRNFWWNEEIERLQNEIAALKA